MNKKVGVLVLSLILLTTLASAEIFLSKQPESSYSLGDTMEIILGSDGTPGWASIDLSCSDKTKIIYYHYLTSSDTKKTISVPLTKDFLRGLNGECALILTFGNDSKSSMGFTIYDSISVDIKFNALSFEPKSKVTYSGTASKPNNKEVNGFIELSIEDTLVESISQVLNNKFSGEFEIPEGLPSGNYKVNIFIYEKTSSGEVTNFGYSEVSIAVSQIPDVLEIEVPRIIEPDTSMEFKAVLRDHTGQTINGAQTSFRLINVNGEEVMNILSETDKPNYFNLQKNAPVGYWNFSAESKGLKKEIQIYITENKEASFDLINGTLFVTNLGNVLYDNSIEISIDEHKKVFPINLSLGESISFELEAPEGEYNITITDGSNIYSGVSALTGKVIAIKSPTASFKFFDRRVFVWTFLIMVFGLFLFISSKKIIKRKENFPINPNLKIKSNSARAGVLKINTSKGIETSSTEAKYSSVIDGLRQSSSVLTIKIKNNEEIKSSGMDISEHIESIEKTIVNNEGRIYKSGEYIIGIFNPLVTRTFENSIKAVKSAKKISDELNNFNKVAKVKIKFGLSVNSGDLVARKHEGVLLFNPTGNLLINSKKISEISENNLLISEDANKKLLSKAKTAPNPDKFGIKTYSLKEILDEKENAKFINSFMKRNQYKNEQKNEFKSLDNFKI